MGERLVKFFVLVFLLLALANLFLPDFLYERVMAAISPNSGQKMLFYQIEPGNDRELADRLNLYLAGNQLTLDNSFTPEQSMGYPAKKLTFQQFDPEKPVSGAKIVKIELLNPLEKTQIPVCLSFFRCENKLIQIHKSSAVLVERSADDEETARRIGKLLALAFKSIDA